MQEIPIHLIADGQELAEDVRDETGQVLLSAGTVLSRTHVDLLERRGVLTVKIADAAGGAGGALEPAAGDLENALRRLDHMFEGLTDDPVMHAIHAAARGMLESALRGAQPGSGRGEAPLRG